MFDTRNTRLEPVLQSLCSTVRWKEQIQTHMTCKEKLEYQMTTLLRLKGTVSQPLFSYCLFLFPNHYIRARDSEMAQWVKHMLYKCRTWVLIPMPTSNWMRQHIHLTLRWAYGEMRSGFVGLAYAAGKHQETWIKQCERWGLKWNPSLFSEPTVIWTHKHTRKHSCAWT